MIAPFLVFGANAQTPAADVSARAEVRQETRAQMDRGNHDAVLVCTDLEHNLFFGSRDRTTDGEVSELKAFLRAEGHLRGNEGGVFNFPTFRAVRAFQAAHDLSVTGMVNAETRGEIKEVSCGTDDDGELRILGISAPTALEVGEEGTWTVDVESEAEGNLRYSVVWGDENARLMSALHSEDAVQSSATFTHTYHSEGAFTPTFTVTDAEGNTVTKAAATVTVSEDIEVEISSLSKVTGYVGDEITISGSGFSGDSKVFVGGTEAGEVTVHGDSSITFSVPSLGSGSYDVYVENENGTSNTIRFEVLVEADVRISISSIDAPVRLAVNEEGTWTVNADTNATGNLRYSVVWGDEGMVRSMLGTAATVQTSSTFTHSYAREGVYKPKFTISDGAGHSSSVSATVVVTK